MSLFALGRIVATSGVTAQVPGVLVDTAIMRHSIGDWGDLDAHDMVENSRALATGGRLMSVFHLAEFELWVITEHDRSVTTVLFPSDY